MIKRYPSFIFLQLTAILLILFFSDSILHKTIFDKTKMDRQAHASSPKTEQTIRAVTIRVVTPLPTTPTPSPYPKSSQNKAWGIAQKIDEHSWTMKVNSDAKTGSAQEIFAALNNYRSNHGRGILSWHDGLANYAQSRANGFLASGALDAHAGFNDFIKNQDGFHKLGFMSLGENSSLGYQLEAVHLIEWVFAGDAPHNDNQLNSGWSHVGIGVAGNAVDIIFGGGKM